MGEAVLAVVGLGGTIMAMWLTVSGLRGVSKSLPADSERIWWHTFKMAYPASLIGMAAGAAVAIFTERRLTIEVDTMPGLEVLIAGLLVGVAPGIFIAARGGREYQRALDAHYEGTRWARSR